MSQKPQADQGRPDSEVPEILGEWSLPAPVMMYSAASGSVFVANSNMTSWKKKQP